MTVWNVAVPVVALVEADTEDGALRDKRRGRKRRTHGTG